MAEGVTIANAFVQVMPSAEGAEQKLNETLLPQLGGVGEKGGASLGASLFSSLKGVFGGLFAAYSAGELVEMIIDAGIEWQEATRTLVVGTGATGDALAGLQDNVKAVSGTIATGFGDSADIIQNLNTRLGITGDTLEGVSKQTAALGAMFGDGINLDTLTGTFNRWHVTGEDMNRTLDNLFVITQQTGVGFDELTAGLEKNRYTFETLGLNIDQAAVLFGNLDKAGFDASGMLNVLQRNLTDFTEYGPTAEEGFRNIVAQITELASQGAEGEAAARELADSIFGGRYGADIVSACQEGVLSLDNLDGSLGDTTGAIMDTYSATSTLSDEWETLGNNAKSAFEPITSEITGFLTDYIQTINTSFQEGSVAVQGSVTVAQANAERFGSIGQSARGGFEPFVNWIKDVPHQIAQAFSTLGEQIRQAFANAAQQAKSAWTNSFVATGVVTIDGKQQNLGQIRWFADGGIVDSPTVFGAGEAGPEAIIPLHGGNMDNLAASIAAKTGSREDVTGWLARNLPQIIETYTPTMTRREFSRAVTSVV